VTAVKENTQVAAADGPAGRPLDRAAGAAEHSGVPVRAAEAPGGPARPRRLIMTLYGCYARDEGDWLSVASLIRLMGDLGVDSQAVRSSVSRLKRRGMLCSLARSGAAGYALSGTGLSVLRDRDVRIFGRRRATAQDGWVLVTFSVPEAERGKRHELRATLARLGFGTVAPGVWVAPGTLAGQAMDALGRRGLDRYADVFAAEHLGSAAVAAQVRQWWDLDALAARYERFTTHYQPLATLLASGATPPARAAFQAYIPLLASWQQLPYADPGLPLDLLPAGWAGVTAANLFSQLNGRLAGAAAAHARSLVRR
jgi:phenylacetic acid degradation operon negative regulatory protein